MIKKNWKILTVSSVVCLLPMVAGLLLWNRMAERIPLHWNMQGVVDGWGSRAFAVFGLPLLMLAFHWLGLLAMHADPKKQNHAPKFLKLMWWFIPALSVLLCACVYSAGMGKSPRVELIAPLLIGILFIVVGNYLPKCKQNYTVGIKLPWTLDSEENWNKTHRFAGWVWVIGGILILLFGFLASPWIILPVGILMVLLPLVYSFLLYRKEKGKEE